MCNYVFQELREAMKEEKKEKEAKKTQNLLNKAKRQENFIRCKDSCVCSQDVCLASGLKQCTLCKDVMKTQCSKGKCKVSGVKPVMLTVSFDQKHKRPKKIIVCFK